MLLEERYNRGCDQFEVQEQRDGSGWGAVECQYKEDGCEATTESDGDHQARTLATGGLRSLLS